MVKALKMGDYSGLSRWAQRKDASPSKRQREGEECVRDGVLALRAEEGSHRRWPPGAGSGLQLIAREKQEPGSSASRNRILSPLVCRKRLLRQGLQKEQGLLTPRFWRARPVPDLQTPETVR